VEYYDSMTYPALPQALNPNCPSAFCASPKALLDLLQFMRFGCLRLLPIYFMTSAERMRISEQRFRRRDSQVAPTSQDLRCAHLV